MDPMLAGLVRVVTPDGLIVWTLPAHAPIAAATTVRPFDPDFVAFYRRALDLYHDGGTR